MFIWQSGHTTLPKVSSLFYWSFWHSDKTRVKTTDSNQCQTNANQPTPTKPPVRISHTIHYNQLLTDETAVRGGKNCIFDTQQPFFTMVFMGKMSEVMYRSQNYDDIFQELVINIAFFCFCSSYCNLFGHLTYSV